MRTGPAIFQTDELTHPNAIFLCKNHPNSTACQSFGRDPSLGSNKWPGESLWLAGRPDKRVHYQKGIKGKGGAHARWTRGSEWNTIQSFAHIVKNQGEEWDLRKDYDGPPETYEANRVYHNYVNPEDGFRFLTPVSQEKRHKTSQTKKQFIAASREMAMSGAFGDLEALRKEWDEYIKAMEQGTDYDTSRLKKIMNPAGKQAGALIEVIFENRSTAEAAKEANMKPNTLTVQKRRALERSERTLFQESEKILDRITAAQWADIDAHGGFYAFRLASNGRAEMLRFRGNEPYYLLYKRNDADQVEAAKNEHGWTEIEARLCDKMCDIGRQWTAWFAFVDRIEALPKKERLIASKDRASWMADKKAWAFANKMWNRVVCFNFGAPGFYSHFPKHDDPGFEEVRLALVRSGRRPGRVVSPTQDKDLASIHDDLESTLSHSL